MDVVNSGVTRFYRSIYSVAEHARERQLVLYGAGFWGETAGAIFSQLHVYPTYFCDDDIKKQGTCVKIDGRSIPVISLDEATERLPDAVYIATAASGADAPRTRMNQELKERGLLSEDSGFHPLRYLFLLEGGLEALKCPAHLGENSFRPEHLENMLVLNHMSNSGITFFDTLVDGHPNILSIVMLGAEFFLKDLYLERLQYLEEEELVLEIASQMTPYFASRFPDRVFGTAMLRVAYHYLACEDGSPAEQVCLSPTKFVSALGGLLYGQGRVSFGYLLKTVFAAYYNAIGKLRTPGLEYWIYYSRHKENYNLCEMDELLSPTDFKSLEYWFIVREPIQHLFSWCRRSLVACQPGLRWFVGRPEIYLGVLASDMGLMLEKTELNRDKAVKIVRFEDTKKNTRGTMMAVCDRLGIPFNECMLETTAHGLPISFLSPRTATEGKVMSARDTSAVDRQDFSELLSPFDIVRLNLVFQDFKRVCGYACDVPDYRDFSESFWEELYKLPFRFESELDRAGAEAFRTGRLAEGEQGPCHDHIVQLFLSYLKRGKGDLFTEVVRPLEVE